MPNNSAKAQPQWEFVNVSDVMKPVYTELYRDVVMAAPDPIELQASLPCYDNDVCVRWRLWTSIQYIVEHPNFPGCPVAVTVRIRTCDTDITKIQMYITSIALKTPSADDCKTLKNYLGWNGTDIAIDDVNNIQFEHDLYALISKHHFKILNDFAGGMYCGDYDHVRISYYGGTCYGACHGYFILPGGFQLLLKVRRYCAGGESCCRVENVFCIDEATGALRHSYDKIVINYLKKGIAN